MKAIPKMTCVAHPGHAEGWGPG